MRLGVMSDIHGNTTAMRAVLADAASIGIEEWWVLGDLVAVGPDPVGVLELLDSLSRFEVIAGNTERYLLTGDLPWPTVDAVLAHPELMPRLVEVAAGFGWTKGVVAHAGRLGWVAALPAQLRRTLPDGTRMLGVHASPLSDDGAGIDTLASDADLAAMVVGCDADIVIGGHTHDLTDRVVAGVRAVNPGSVSNSRRADRCATYAIVEASADGHSIEHRVVDYDHAAELAKIAESGHPGTGFLRRFHE